MAADLVELVFRQSRVKGGALLIMLAIAGRTNYETGACYPSIADIAQRTRLGERQVTRLIREELVPSGELEIVRKGGGRHLSNHYRICLPNPDPQATVTSPRTLSPKPSIQPAGNGNETLTSEPETLTPKARNPDARVTRTVRIVTKNRKKLRARGALDFDKWLNEFPHSRGQGERQPDAKVERWLLRGLGNRFGGAAVMDAVNQFGDRFFVWAKVRDRAKDDTCADLSGLATAAAAEYELELRDIAQRDEVLWTSSKTDDPFEEQLEKRYASIKRQQVEEAERG